MYDEFKGLKYVRLRPGLTNGHHLIRNASLRFLHWSFVCYLDCLRMLLMDGTEGGQCSAECMDFAVASMQHVPWGGVGRAHASVEERTCITWRSLCVRLRPLLV